MTPAKASAEEFGIVYASRWPAKRSGGHKSCRGQRQNKTEIEILGEPRESSGDLAGSRAACEPPANKTYRTNVGAAWLGTVQRDVVWCGVVWRGAARRGVARRGKQGRLVAFRKS